jgi:hypothetical protein
VLGHGIINGCPVVAGVVSEVVGVESGGMPVWMDCVFAEESLLHWYGGYCDRLDFRVEWDLGFDIAPFVVGKSLSLVGYSSHLGVEWGFSKWTGGGGCK